jgi:hypothetical protein
MIGMMGSLGAVSIVTTASQTHAKGSDIGGGPAGGTGGPSMRGAAVTARATSIVGPMRVTGSMSGPSQFNIVSPPGQQPVSCQPGYVYDSKLLQCVTPPGTATTSGGSGGGGTVTSGGGGGGDTSTTIPPPDAPPPPPTDTTAPPDDNLDASGGASSTNLTNLALLAAAGGALWFLFLRKRPGGGA